MVALRGDGFTPVRLEPTCTMYGVVLDSGGMTKWSCSGKQTCSLARAATEEKPLLHACLLSSRSRACCGEYEGGVSVRREETHHGTQWQMGDDQVDQGQSQHVNSQTSSAPKKRHLGQGDKGTRGQGGQGGEETRRQGDKMEEAESGCLRASHSCAPGLPL